MTTTQPQNGAAIQHFRFNFNGPKNETECARAICGHLGWLFDDEDRVVESTGNLVGLTIEDVANAMVDIGWVIASNGSDGGWLPHYTPVPNNTGQPNSAQAAADLGQYLPNGMHSGWRTKGPNGPVLARP